MAKIVVTYKIFPTDIAVNLEELRRSIQQSLPPNAEVYGYSVEPIAFGLNALIAHIIIPEGRTGILSQLEERIQGIPEVSQIQSVMVRRTH